MSNKEDKTGKLIVASERLKHQRNFTRIPNEIILHPDLSMGAKLTWEVIFSFCYDKNVAWPGVKKLSDKLKVSKRTAQRYLRELENEGLLETVVGGGEHTNVYKLFTPCMTDMSPMTEKSRDPMTSVSPKEDEGTTSTNKKEEASQQEKNKQIADELSNLKDNIGVPYEKVKGLWDTLAEKTEISKIAKLSQKRKGKLRKRWEEWEEYDDQKTYETYKYIINKIYITPFLHGHNERGWQIDFDWLTKNDTNWIKVVEGKYEDTEAYKDDNLDHGMR